MAREPEGDVLDEPDGLVDQRPLGGVWSATVPLSMTAELSDRLRDVLIERPGLALAILFGSRARGSGRLDSDVDIAILPGLAGLSPAEENDLGVELERVAGATVDLVRLDEASAALQWRIARDGVVLLSNPPSAAPRFLARAGIAHDYDRHLVDEATRRFHSRVAEADRGPGS